MAENTWNPVTGCTRISNGCKNCYAAVMAQRLKLMGNKKYVNRFEIVFHEYCLNDLLKWKKPSLVFLKSMSDLFQTMGWDKQEEKWTVIAWANLGCYAGNRGQITDKCCLV